MSKMFMNCNKLIKFGDNCDTLDVTDMSLIIKIKDFSICRICFMVLPILTKN